MVFPLQHGRCYRFETIRIPPAAIDIALRNDLFFFSYQPSHIFAGQRPLRGFQLKGDGLGMKFPLRFYGSGDLFDDVYEPLGFRR